MKNLVAELISQRSDWLTFLQETYKVKVVYSEDKRLVSLKYDQLESPMAEPIVCQCRGMVVDVIAGKILSWPYDKFWNLGEARAAEIDWSTARVLEKLDGSLLQLFWDPILEDWAVASSGHPTAGGSFGTDSTKTFRDAFWEILCAANHFTPDPEMWADVTFMFELCAPENRVVVKHDERRLVLHGARTRSGREFGLDELQYVCTEYGWKLVESHPITSPEEALRVASERNPAQHEGFVVVDSQFNRVKIKSPQYVSLHHMKGEFCHRRCVELWQTGETSELLLHFPEFAAEIGEVHAKLDDVVLSAWLALEQFSDGFWPATRKEFASLVKDQKFSSLAFKLYGTSIFTMEDVKRLLREQSLASLERLAA